MRWQDAYPELKESADRVAKVVEAEEKQFARMMSSDSGARTDANDVDYASSREHVSVSERSSDGRRFRRCSVTGNSLPRGV